MLCAWIPWTEALHLKEHRVFQCINSFISRHQPILGTPARGVAGIEPRLLPRNSLLLSNRSSASVHGGILSLHS